MSFVGVICKDDESGEARVLLLVKEIHLIHLSGPMILLQSL